jgi:probable rRNA maturation factor
VSHQNHRPIPAGTLAITNRQRRQPIRRRLLREIATHLLVEQCGLRAYDLSLCLLAAPAMTRLNEQFVGHAGCTDVITFDYAGGRSLAPTRRGGTLQGEIFICVDEAVLQARRFRTSWQSEVVRYLVHGVLHLRGYDDLHPAARRRMKRQESRLLRALAARFALSQLARRSKLQP